jgi:phosphoribosyl 1,2-cyclic phosphodiesterase
LTGDATTPRELTLRFWGVRGSLPVPGPETVRHGGNTACVEVRCGGRLLILDAGSGLRALGDALMRERTEGQSIEADLLCSHTHLDHVCGLPFFAPLYDTGTRLRLWFGHRSRPNALKTTLSRILSNPLGPNLLPHVRAKIRYARFRPGDVLSPSAGLEIVTAALRHPGGSVGFRLEWAGKVVAYITDTEHDPEAPDSAVLRLAQGADILIYDATYTDEELAGHVGWGHSTWQEGVRLANAAAVKRLVLFHHAPSRTDGDLDQITADAKVRRPETIAAREGMELSL